ncbi:MAG: hypothetical protein QG552_474 [Thermodesulfobacteriota bacterium]|nr:hypothetical protein [Thermodesulfobacteriota bacterium]
MVFSAAPLSLNQCHNGCFKSPVNEDSTETCVPDRKENFQATFPGELDGDRIGADINGSVNYLLHLLDGKCFGTPR